MEIPSMQIGLWRVINNTKIWMVILLFMVRLNLEQIVRSREM